MTTQELTTNELFEIFPEAYEIVAELARERSEAYQLENELWEAEYYEREKEKKITYVREKLKNTKQAKVGFEEFVAGIMQIGIREELKRDITPEIRDMFIRANRNKLYSDWVEPLDKEIKRLERIIRKYEWSKNPQPAGSITDDDIAHAKEFRITSLVTPNRQGRWLDF